jgi:hypothetical protein
MSCLYVAPGVHVCGVGQPSIRRFLRCWNCKQRRAVVQTGEPYSYYAPHFVCLTCGDGWGDGERQERPFARGWRQESIRRARLRWKHAITRAQYDELGRAVRE